MSKIVRVQGGDYRIVVGSQGNPGTIYLDTNPSDDRNFSQGNVVVTGDLTVLGKSTVIESETLAIKDNIIYLNQGETGAGVSTLGTTSGFQVDRGSLIDVSFLWDENLETGSFKAVDASDNLKAIATNKIVTRGTDLFLIANGNGIVSVAGTVDYEEQVLDYERLGVTFNISFVERINGIGQVYVLETHGLIAGDVVDVVCGSNLTFNGNFIQVVDAPTPTSFTYVSIGADVAIEPANGFVRVNPILDDDTIPNIRAVADYINILLPTVIVSKIQENDTIVQVRDADTSGVSEIIFEVDGAQRAVINNSGLNVDNIRIRNNTISNFSNDNLLVDSILSIANRTGTPTTPIGYVKLYSKNDPGTGGTGLYFTNTTGTTDELISKTKALLYSLIL
jgi:hypothetical protein